MTFTVRLHANAQRDFDRIEAYYDAEAPSQTDRFIADFFETAARLAAFPEAGPSLRSGVRRAALRTFPFLLWYRVGPDDRVIQVIAVLHHRQDAADFDDRLI